MARIDGDAGNNLEIGTSAPDQIRGFGGIDLLRGGSGNDTIEGGDGPDSLYGDQGDDRLEGGTGDDVLRGGRGEDTLNGGDGEDTIRSDRDDDLIIGSAGADYINGGYGFDTVDYSDSPRLGGLLYDGVQVSVGASALLLGAGGHAEGDILAGVEAVIGSPYDDLIGVDDLSIAHRAYGGDGDDELLGYEWDYLNGGAGDDTLVTYGGGTLEGGPGADTFWFVGSVDGPTIEDFGTAEGDAISLRSLGVLAGFRHVTRSDVQAMLDRSTGNVLDLTLLGAAEGYEHGSITLGGGVRVSDLTVDNFILDGDADPDPRRAAYDANYDEIAYQLTDAYWRWTAEDGYYGGRRAFNVAPGGTLTADITGLTAEGQQLARWALDAWTNVTGIEFRFVTGDADITFDDDEPGAHGGASEVWPGGEIRQARVNVSADWIQAHGATIDSFALQTYIHEIGHALGLGHPGDYNVSDEDDPLLTYRDDAKFLNDSWQASVMSYFDQTQNTHIDASRAYAVTPMIADIIAIQNLYGFAVVNPGDTVYGYESNVAGYLGELFGAMSGEEPDADVYADRSVALTIYDTGGYDWLDLRWDTADQQVDLRPEGISDVLGLTGNLIIARGTVIELFIAGSGDDTVIGNEADNHLEGVYGNDTLMGGDGDDWLFGGPGADRLDGGAGGDAASYGFSSGVRVDLGAGVASGGEAEGDTLRGIEHLAGSPQDDALTGSDATNWLWGRDGNDTLAGGDGDDYLEGGAGEDLLTGGEGADVFVFGDGDTVTDFGRGNDLIDIRNFDAINAGNLKTSVTIEDGSGGVEVRIGDAVLTLNGVTAADISTDDFLLA